jgi:hypothetical protein
MKGLDVDIPCADLSNVQSLDLSSARAGVEVENSSQSHTKAGSALSLPAKAAVDEALTPHVGAGEPE